MRNVVSMRAEPSDRSERVSQALHGHTVLVLEVSDSYCRVRTADEYEGWMPRSALRLLAPGEVYPDPKRRRVVCRPLLRVYGDGTRSGAAAPYLLSAGSLVECGEVVRLADGSRARLAASALQEPHDAAPTPRAVLATARRFLGIPYLWGGSSAFGLDCSGFVQLVFGLSGVTLPRDADLQAESPLLSERSVDAPMPGDLLFFGPAQPGSGRAITHVAIAVSRTGYIHSSGGLGVAISQAGDETWRGLVRVGRPTIWPAR
ncbi:MAG: C40 family peptidase [Armatimonadetes bacterium]|nr:C40 family peptidase [Armatimonadota bacterium]